MKAKETLEIYEKYLAAGYDKALAITAIDALDRLKDINSRIESVGPNVLNLIEVINSIPY